MSRLYAWLALVLLAAGLITPSVGSAQVTRVEESDPAVTYLNQWYDIPDPSLSAGHALGAFQAGSTVTLSFNGTGLTWIGYRCACAAGIARLYLDGDYLGMIDTYAAAPQAQAEIYSVDGLEAGAHSFTIEVTGNYHGAGSSAYILVDAFDIDGSGTTPPADTVAPEVSLTAPADAAAVSGTVMVSADASDANGVQDVRLLVDGLEVGTYDSAAPYTLFWNTSTVSDGSHQLSVVATDGSGNTAQDSITVQVANTGYLEEYDPAISYSGAWYDLNAPDVSGGSVVGSFHAGVTATVNFNGTGITWIGYRCPCAAGIARVYVDGNLVDTIDTYAPEREARSEIFTVANLPAGEHVLTIDHTGNYHNQGDSAYLIVDAFRVLNGTGSEGEGDTEPPFVRLTSPVGGTISGVITMSVDAQDDTGVVGVQFLLDGEPFGAEDTSAPYAISWDTTTAAEGAHMVSARARDEAGNTGEPYYPPYTDVDNAPAAETTPPSVVFATPTFGTTVLGGSTSLSATATDNVGVARVMFNVDGVFIGQATTAPFTVTWSTQNFADGGYVLRATAYDHDGNGLTSAAHLLNVWNSAASPPIARITAPADGATVSGSVTVAAEAFYPGGISNVTFGGQLDNGTSAGGNNGGSSGDTTPYNFTWNTASLPDGTYRLWVSVRGNDGSFIYSPSVRVVVDN